MTDTDRYAREALFWCVATAAIFASLYLIWSMP
jgi:hypothetical protein